MRRLGLIVFAVFVAAAAWWLGGDDRRAALRRLVTPDPLPRLPRPAAGAPYTHELSADPRPQYGPAPITAADLTFAPLVEQAGLTPDPALGHAARELARFYAKHGRLAPGDALAFLLDAAGAPFWGVRQAVVVTATDGLEPLREALASQGATGWRAGVGEASVGDPPRYVRAALVTRPGMALDPVPRTAAVGDRIHISGTLAPGHRDPGALAATPDGTLIDLPVQSDGARFSTDFTATAGAWQVEVLAEGPAGPAPLAQITIHVDEPLPDIHDGVWPDDSPPADPIAHLAALLAADRAAAGRAPLIVDPTLHAIAAAHSEDMRRHDFVGHTSPRTGQVDDRLRAADYRAAASGENVALNRSLDDAQAGLMRSLGHRRNIVSEDFTHVGLGAARGESGWYVTQVFARPAPALDDPRDAVEALYARITAARARRDAPPLRVDAELAAAADREARRDDASPDSALRTAEPTARARRLTAWTAALLDPTRLELPEALLGADLGRIGVGIHRDPARPLPDVRVVIIAAD